MIRYRLQLPSHLTGFWRIHKAKTITETGSTGAGIVVEPGVQALVEEAPKTIITYNGVKVDICPVKKILGAHNKPVRITVYSPTPLGAGYASSAILSIIAAIAVQLVEKGYYDYLEVGEKAHKAEVECLTGLGDVISILQAGYLEIRTKPGAPGTGRVLTVPLKESLRITTLPLRIDGLQTPQILTTLGDEINKYSDNLLSKLLDNPTIENFASLALEFTKKIKWIPIEILTRVDDILLPELRKGNIIGYYYKKKTLVIVHEKSIDDNIFLYLKKYSASSPIKHKPSPGGIVLART